MTATDTTPDLHDVLLANAEAAQTIAVLRSRIAEVQGMYLGLVERSVNDRRRLIARLEEAGLEDPDPREGIRMELLAAMPWAVDATRLGSCSGPAAETVPNNQETGRHG